MNYIFKKDLLDQAWYSGVANGDGVATLGQWDILNNRFMIIKHTAWETYLVPMIYPGDESEYFLEFYPYYLENKEQING